MTRKKAGRRRYYGVYGSNGLGVYDNYALVQKETRFIKKHKQKSFDNMEEAKIYAFNGYNAYQAMHRIDERMLDEMWRMNWTYSEKDLVVLKMINRLNMNEAEG